ncbi:hypothetical protein OsI_16311 [Oryza sativa Indica Group]|uniref:Uncharacterized protein n=1 Tax=Oryza sativa subsp. indica TaxID=39946 RepID=B8AVG4_ORYSI|nr:hypothetical protein OsI_16311 [Oryza sativa Indica Group]
MAAQQQQHMSMSASSSLVTSLSNSREGSPDRGGGLPEGVGDGDVGGGVHRDYGGAVVAEGRFGLGGSSRRRSSLNAFDIFSFSPAAPAPAAEISTRTTEHVDEESLWACGGLWHDGI